MRFPSRLALFICLFLAGSLQLPRQVAHTEKADMTPQALRETATHVVVGEVRGIYTRKHSEGGWRYTRYVAEVSVAALEKGDGPKVGELVYVRYWTRAWEGREQMPPATTGHRDIPIAGQTLRIYLARNAYDGFTRGNHDGGYNVVGANGFEVPVPPAPEGPARAGWLPAKQNLRIGVWIYEGAGSAKKPYGVVLRFVGQDFRVSVRYTGGDLDGVEDSLLLSAPWWSNMFVRADDRALK